MEQWRTPEREYTITETTFTKSEIPEAELMFNYAGEKICPQWSRERLQNEAATLQFIASATTIPVPKFLDLYEENGVLHLKTEYVPGRMLDKIGSDVVTKHVINYVESTVLPQLRNLRRCTVGSVDETLPVIPPSRITYRDKRPIWPRRTSPTADFVFCHNDLAQHNILVDPETMQVTAIIDWEFAGYYAPEFEYPLWLKSVREQGDGRLQTDHLVKFLEGTG